ncbi:MAG: hypothetical protein M3277_07910 [Actinomycetota bacterium]|nr:hypothetical protein [Actinomycetota bacterium]
MITRQRWVMLLWTVALVLSVAGIFLTIVNSVSKGGVFTPQSFLAPGYASVGAFILARRPHRIAWLFLGFGLFVGATGAVFQACESDMFQGLRTSFVCAESRLGAALWPANYAFFGALLLLFPDGRLPSRRWRWIATLFVLSWSAASAGALVGGDRFVEERLGFVLPLAVYSLIAVATAPLFRARRSDPTEKKQLRYLAYVIAVTLALVVLVLVPADLLGLRWLFDGASALLLFNAALGVPISIGVAILRYRLYEIDLIINRTLVYAVLTAVLLGSYLLIVVALSRILDPVTRDSDIAVAASTLAVAALFRPLRARIQAFIDRRFYRAKYDAERALEGFGARLRDEIEVDVVRADVLGVVRDTLQPSHASVWIKPGEAT